MNDEEIKYIFVGCIFIVMTIIAGIVIALTMIGEL